MIRRKINNRRRFNEDTNDRYLRQIRQELQDSYTAFENKLDELREMIDAVEYNLNGAPEAIANSIENGEFKASYAYVKINEWKDFADELNEIIRTLDSFY